MADVSQNVADGPTFMSAEQLRDHLDALPQELYDEIYGLVFAVIPGERIIRPTWKPPIQLQISKSTRAEFANRYFGGGSSFKIGSADKDIGQSLKARSRMHEKWVKSLDPEHKSLIEQLRIAARDPALEGPRARWC